jgi:FtsH-binding integral membrane protein
MIKTENTYPMVESDAQVKSFMIGVYLWMTLGILVTGLVSLFTLRTPFLFKLVFANYFTFFGIIIVEIALVFFLSARVMKMSSSAGIFFFLLYAAINGLTLSIIFKYYTGTSITRVFFITSGTFAAMTAYGFFTKRDLSGWGNILFMGLIGIIIASVVNFFLKSTMLYWIISYAGVAIFIALTAYDTQRIKRIYLAQQEGEEFSKRLAILGALHLYLDFINLFLFLLRIFGRRR